MNRPHEIREGQIPASDISPRPARFKPTAISIIALGLAFFLLGLGLLGFAKHIGDKVNSRSVQRDLQHSQTEQQLAAANAKIASLQAQLERQQKATAALASKTHDGLCTVAFGLQPKSPSDPSYQVVINFERQLGCRPPTS